MKTSIALVEKFDRYDNAENRHRHFSRRVAFARSGFAADQCSPFGDPPAQINRGLFATSFSAHNPICFGGRVLGPWKDSDGSDRYACIYEPEQHSRDNPLPLLVFLHGSIATADSIRLTGLTGEIDKGDLGGKKPGFIVLAPEGRYTSHYYPGLDSNAMGWDNWYRQLSPGRCDCRRDHIQGECRRRRRSIISFQDEIATGEVDAVAHLSDRMVQWRGDGDAVCVEPSIDRGRCGLFGAQSVRRIQRSMSANAGAASADLQRASADLQSAHRADARAQQLRYRGYLSERE